jgi:hypothetical protein
VLSIRVHRSSQFENILAVRQDFVAERRAFSVNVRATYILESRTRLVSDEDKGVFGWPYQAYRLALATPSEIK